MQLCGETLHRGAHHRRETHQQLRRVCRLIMLRVLRISILLQHRLVIRRPGHLDILRLRRLETCHMRRLGTHRPRRLDTRPLLHLARLLILRYPRKSAWQLAIT